MLKMKLNLQFFASGTLTGNVVTSSSNTKLQMKLEWSSVENIATNTSTVTTKLYGKRADSLSGATSGKNWGGKVQVGSNTAHSFSSVSSQISVSTSWVLFKTYTDTITHNPDGTKSVTITASLNGCGGTSLAGLTSSASGTATLGTIPRGSILGDIEDFNIDDTINISITKYVETYTDNLVISCGETTIKTINDITNNAEVSFTEEEKNVIRSLMTSPKLELTFTLTTLNGTETLGSSIETARVSSFDKPIAFNVRKTDSGHYRWAFNGLVDDANESPLQVYDDEGNSILERGSNENGEWVVYPDGTMICSYTQVVTVNIDSSWGSLYQGVVNLQDYPKEFADTPNATISLLTNSSKWGGWLGVAGKSSDIEPSNTNPGSVSILRPTTGSSAKYKIGVVAVGKWKGE